ncbi:MAG TPA: hypothetical protein VM580_32090 [Labilithrix sp.]|nr:hypothetical protein [Labilithrix sp.]
MKRLGIVFPLSSLSLFCNSACSSESSPHDAASADSDLVARVLADAAEVHADKLVFPTAAVPASLRERITAFEAALAAGKSREEVENVILTGDRAPSAVDPSGKIKEDAKNPYGYIRRALSIRDEGGKTIISTEHATLEEAFAELSAGQFIEIGTEPTGTGVSPLVTKTLKTNIPPIHFDGIEMLRLGGTSLHLGSGFVSVDVGLDIGAAVAGYRLTHAHVNYNAKIASELTISAQVEGADEWSGEYVITDSKWPLETVGPAPATLALRLVANCELNSSGSAVAKTGVRSAVGVVAGAQYDAGEGPRTSGDGLTLDAGPVLPQVEADGTAKVKCSLRPEFEVFLFDSPSVRLIPSLSTRIEGESPPLRAKLVQGIDSAIGLKLGVFGKNLAEIERQLPPIEKQLWSFGYGDGS